MPGHSADRKSSNLRKQGKHLAASGALALGLALAGGQIEAAVSGGSVARADNDKNKDKDKVKEKDVNLAATPELDSLVLFGTGAAAMAGYAVTRLRARPRRK
jgi:hypothetical protein